MKKIPSPDCLGNNWLTSFMTKVEPIPSTSAAQPGWKRPSRKKCGVRAQAIDEYNQSGKLTNFFSSVLDHFKELPAIEQAQYPKDYAADLQSKIDLDFNYRTHRAEGKDKGPMSLIEMLFEQSPQQADELPQEPKILPTHQL